MNKTLGLTYLDKDEVPVDQHIENVYQFHVPGYDPLVGKFEADKIFLMHRPYIPSPGAARLSSLIMTEHAIIRMIHKIGFIRNLLDFPDFDKKYEEVIKRKPNSLSKAVRDK